MFRMKFGRLFLLLLVALTACVPGGETERTAVSSDRLTDSVSTTDETALLALVKRLLAPRYPGSPEPDDVQLLVGQLPPDFAVTLPDTMRVVGSLVRGEESVEIVLDSDLSAESAFDALRADLEKQGWRVALEPGYGGGFVSGDVSQSVTFCQDEQEATMWAMVFAPDNEPADVRLNFQGTQSYSVCKMDERYGYQNEAEKLLPQLKSPAGARQEGGGGGSGSYGGYYNSADLLTEIPATDLLLHYGAQLQDAGWTKLEEETAVHMAWSAWSFTDDDGNEWRGSFWAADLTDDRRMVLVQIIKP